MPDYLLIIVAIGLAAWSGFLISAKYLSLGIIVGVIAAACGIWKEIRAYDASGEAQHTINNLNQLIEKQSEEIKKQSEKLTNVIKNQDINQKYNETIDYSIKRNESPSIRWSSVWGHFEITRANCDFNINMYYQKDIDVMEKLRIDESLDKYIIVKQIKSLILKIIPTEDLRRIFKGELQLSRRGDPLFRKGSVVNSTLVRDNLRHFADIDFLTAIFIGPIFFKIEPAPDFKDRDCRIGIYSP